MFKVKACQMQGVLAGFHRKCQLFDVTAIDRLRPLIFNLGNNIMRKRDKNLNLVSSEAVFSTVSGSEISVIILFVNCLQRKIGHKSLFWFFRKIRSLPTR